MGFVNEVVSDEDIVRYNLPFALGSGRYWTRDKERDCYLWGGILESYSRGLDPEGRFWLFLYGRLLDVSLNLDAISSSFKESPFRIVWKEVSDVQPYDLGGLEREVVFAALKDALQVFGYDGEKNLFVNNRIVEFKF